MGRWQGRCFEEFEVGAVYEHRAGRTVTSTDNIWFTLLTMNTHPVHLDHAYAARTEIGRPLVNSTLTLAIVTGITVADVSQNAVANLGWDKVRLPAPLFEGDTLYARSEVLELRPRVPPEGGHRPGPHHRLQPAWHHGHRVRAHHHGLSTRSPAFGATSFRSRRDLVG